MAFDLRCKESIKAGHEKEPLEEEEEKNGRI